MDQNAVLERLRAHESELKAMGVARLPLFGWLARTHRRQQRIEFSAELDHARVIHLLDFAQINARLKGRLGRQSGGRCTP